MSGDFAIWLALVIAFAGGLGLGTCLGHKMGRGHRP